MLCCASVILCIWTVGALKHTEMLVTVIQNPLMRRAVELGYFFRFLKT